MYRGALPALEVSAQRPGETIMLKQEAAEYNLLVTHHLSEPSHSRTDIGQMMETFGEWIEVATSVYVLWTSIPRREVHDCIRRAVNQNDTIAVIDLAGSFSGPEGLLSLATH
jgi:hypothetical protein